MKQIVRVYMDLEWLGYRIRTEIVCEAFIDIDNISKIQENLIIIIL